MAVYWPLWTERACDRLAGGATDREGDSCEQPRSDAVQCREDVTGGAGGMPGVESMAYEHAGPNGSRKEDMRLFLRGSQVRNKQRKEGRLTGSADLAQAKGIRILHSYCTNPTPEELERWWMSDKRWRLTARAGC
eukprot:768551-Hanusia_phi.AAC.6